MPSCDACLEAKSSVCAGRSGPRSMRPDSLPDPPDWQYAASSPLTSTRSLRQQSASRHFDPTHLFLPRHARTRVALGDRRPRPRAVRRSRNGTRRERRMVLVRAPAELPSGSTHVLGGAATSGREPVVRCPRGATVSRRHALAALRNDGAAGRQRRVLDAPLPRTVRIVGASPSDVHVRFVPPPLQPHREPRALHRHRSKSRAAGQRRNVADRLRVGQDRPQYQRQRGPVRNALLVRTATFRSSFLCEGAS